MTIISIKNHSSSIASIAGSLVLGVGTMLVNQCKTRSLFDSYFYYSEPSLTLYLYKEEL